jgi:hypothetical protein
MSRTFLPLAPEDVVARRVVRTLAPLGVVDTDIARVVDALTAAGVTHAPTVDVAPALPAGPDIAPGVLRNVADDGAPPVYERTAPRPFHTAPAVSYPRPAAPSGRTTAPERRAPVVAVKRRTYTVAGHVPQHERRALLARCACEGACGCAQSYPALEGAPVGSLPTLAAAAREARAALDDARWARQNARAEAGEVVTRSTLRNRKRAAARARARGPL